MATLLNTAKLSARIARQTAPRHVSRRGFKVSRRQDAASNFTMPALSPTMTEGNIASWRVKEGDTFSAGDVLLEIETDKATMDVEAQEDGVMVKVMAEDGAKGVKVGTRIAVIAESGDDAKSIEIPAEEGKKEVKSPQESVGKKESSPSAAESPPTSRPEVDTAAQKKPAASSGKQAGKAKKQTYPLYPSVEHLLHLNGLTAADADSIPASGPNNRLLKGDVLAHLGRINKEHPGQITARLQKLGHLDLSNIQIAQAPPKRLQPAEQVAEPELPKETELAVPISLSAVIATQKRVNDTLGIFLPLSTFIARASELANEDLPLAKNRKPTADDLFNSVLGLDKVSSKSSRGHFVPQVTGLAPAPLSIRTGAAKKSDILDLLTSSKSKKSAPRVVSGAVGISAGGNVFSVTAKVGEEKRAAEYLERMKMALEKEPGRLVL
ncbi:pyridoxine biosynthesis protein [Elasticomyces elasticus]|nr:pyridoxine biosynthesis protein [Elasticomyces elasticus]KAK3643815.1 pyridoxine biosynthesis protein [Elasticomyces elasticus]KAK4912664.1 pyridoxine biosynthesis protein [Elasticomyces elasticus]KAK5752113.1 pyridoxine biosynthesis protein [Elasticomyces elasticus]